ncbi:MAG TPA: Rrf2 family transcriptional regulator [Novosphingobium sp.]|nr:Rrf2 family transcriptional regulator [Novosphingobium sp.]
MRLSQGVEWAAHACVILAAIGQGRALSKAALAEYHGVPAPYLAKQMQLLSRAGLVRTSRGKAGGYALARPADAITLWDITRAIDGPAPLFRCTEIRQRGPCAATRADCRRPCTIAAAFAEAEAAWRAVLMRTAIADIAATVAGESRPEAVMQAVQWLGGRITALPAEQS